MQVEQMGDGHGAIIRMNRLKKAPQGRGFATPGALTEVWPPQVSMFGDRDKVLVSSEAGALGDIHKGVSPSSSMRAGRSCSSTDFSNQISLKPI